MVDSTETRRQHLFQSKRRLLDAPVGLAGLASTDDVLRQLIARQAAIGQAPGARRGNSRKRELLGAVVSVPTAWRMLEDAALRWVGGLGPGHGRHLRSV